MGSRRPGSVEQMEAIRLFLDLVVGEDGSASDERALASVLDRLALAARLTPLPEETTDLEAPPRDYAGLSARIAARFPDYGLYRAPNLDLEDEPLVGDAIDDLTDIALELQDVACCTSTPASPTPCGTSVSASIPTGGAICARCSGICTSAEAAGPRSLVERRRA